MIRDTFGDVAPAFYVWRPEKAPGFICDFVERCALLCRKLGFTETGRPAGAAFAIAPSLRRKLSREEFSAPNFGTLIFHPSILPVHRGPDAIKWALHRHEPVSGVTWFWATEELDAGDIAVQQPLVLDLGASARENFCQRFVPAGLTTLGELLDYWQRNREWPRLPQDERLATVEGAFPWSRAA